MCDYQGQETSDEYKILRMRNRLAGGYVGKNIVFRMAKAQESFSKTSIWTYSNNY